MRRENKTKPTLELIEAKSHWDGDCLIWGGGVAHNAPYMSVNKKSTPVRRWIAENLQGKKTKGLFVTFTCDCNLCVNPDHVVVVTRAKMQKMHADRLQYASNPVRRAKLAKAARARFNTSEEDVEKARNDPRSIRVVAAELGRSFDFVQKIRSGETWKTYGNPFSGLGAK
jgi:hypothetical protein